jgi:parallel beta-helix repeat protein
LYKRGIALSIILLLISLSIVPSTGVNVIKQPAKAVSNGKTLFVGGSGPVNYSKIQDAIDNASDGDTVFVFNGTYCENIKINKSINLFGENKDKTIIDGEGTGIIVKVKSDWINISGFTIKNGGEDSDAIHVYSSYSIINNNIIKNNDRGLHIGDDKNNIISNNTFLDNFIAILFGSYNKWSTICFNNFINNTFCIDTTKSYYIKILKNIFIGNDFGIYLVASAYSIISKNIFTNNRDCIKFRNSYSNNITENTIIENTHAIEFEGGYDNPSNDNIISKNTIANNSGWGIWLIQFCQKNIIAENNIINNRNYGILAYGADNNEIYKNNIKNTEGISVCLDYTTENRIYSNNFINNQKDARFTYSPGVLFNANKWKQNYWNKQRLHPKCIFGRMKILTITFPWIDFDWHPVEKPYDI